VTTDALSATPSLVRRDPRRSRRGGALRAWRRWLLAFAGFFLLSAGWALATPYDGAPDEMQHVLRGSGVAYGEIAPEPVEADLGTGAFQTASPGLVRKNCWMFDPMMRVNCDNARTPDAEDRKPRTGEPGGGGHPEKVATRAGRYNPVYYATVGLPLRLWPNWNGIMMARMISAGLVAAMLASAAYSAAYWARNRLLLAGVLVGTTPMTLHLAGSVNPNALEIAAGTALFTALIPILLDEGAKVRTAALVQAGVAGSVLVTLRALGPLWCAVILTALLLPTTRATVRKLWQSRAARWTAVAIGAATLAAVAWTVLMKANKLGQAETPPDMSFGEAVRYIVVNRWGGYLSEMVGVMSWLDARPPGWAYVLWYLAAGGVLVWGFLLGRRADRWRMAALVVVAFAVPTISDAVNVQKSGLVTQGRYLLPVMVGVPLIAAYAIGRSGLLDAARSTSLVRGLALMLVPLQLVFLWFTMIRWQSGIEDEKGIPNADPLAGPWHPQAGSLVPLVVFALGCVAMGAYYWTAARGDSAEVPAAESPAEPVVAGGGRA
jgi:hypothetical protein